jgi:hypothetical protein
MPDSLPMLMNIFFTLFQIILKLLDIILFLLASPFLSHVFKFENYACGLGFKC